MKGSKKMISWSDSKRLAAETPVINLTAALFYTNSVIFNGFFRLSANSFIAKQYLNAQLQEEEFSGRKSY